MKSKEVIIRTILEEWILVLIFVGLLVTSVISRRIPHYDYTDLRVICILFVFLVVIKGFENSGYLKYISMRIRKDRYLMIKLILITALLSPLLTNDVALITMIPITISFEIENLAFAVVMETAVANIASAISPIGNPQNIFIYHHYGLYPLEFVTTISLFTVLLLFMAFVVSIVKSVPTEEIKKEIRNNHFDRKAYIYLLLFIIFIPVSLRILPLYLGILPVVYAFLFDRESLKIDYIFMLMFIFFFGFTDNLSHILHVGNLNPMEIFLYSSISSQIISNVPATLLFADFVQNWKSLLWGVSVGGLGTLFASLANLISYRFYKMKYKHTKDFLIQFHIYNIAFFLIGVLLYIILISLHIL